jgi:hypothetical protein
MRNHTTANGHVTDEFAKLMVQLASAYAAMSGKLSEPMIRVYAVGLGDLSIDQLKAAMGIVLRESVFWPSVADIRKAALGSADDAGVLAWMALRRAAAEVGSWASLTVEDGAAAHALDATFASWPEFCRLEEGPEMHTRRQEFLAAYRAARGRTRGTKLLGLCELLGPVSQESTRYLLRASGEVAVDRRASSADRRLTDGARCDD